MTDTKMQEMHTTLRAIHKDVTSVKTGIATLKKDVSMIKADIVAIKKDVSLIKDCVATENAEEFPRKR